MAKAKRLTCWFSRHWLPISTLLLGLWVALPWLGPVFMKLGWTNAANAIYLGYAVQCHQLPQRSFFLFGDQFMVSLDQIQAVWQDTNNPLLLRQFTGNPDMGWKVAWSDRMVSMYSSIPLFGLIYWSLRGRVRRLPLWAFLLLLLPMALDGGTHAISDFTGGIGSGFRDSNLWLAQLTNHTLPAAFYAGDALGSFNSWMRLLTGLLFGLGVVWLIYPHLDGGFQDTAQRLEEQLRPVDFENPQSGLSASASAPWARELGGDEAFWTMHDLPFANQEQ